MKHNAAAIDVGVSRRLSGSRGDRLAGQLDEAVGKQMNLMLGAIVRSASLSETGVEIAVRLAGLDLAPGIHVDVEGGFIWRGKTRRSLSVIASEIAGGRRNGPAFFGLRNEGANR